MPNQRKAGKRLIGAMASNEIWAGVDAWIKARPGATVTSFLLPAILEKLARDGIAVNVAEALRDGRARIPSSDDDLVQRVADEQDAEAGKVRRRSSRSASPGGGASPGTSARPLRREEGKGH